VSNNKRKTDYLILGVLGALIIGVLFALVFSGWVRQDRSGMPGVRTTLSTNVDAAIVCYTLFERLGISVGRSEKVLIGDVFGKIDVLFLLNPIIPIHAGEIKNLQAWLIGGGVLICTEIPKGLRPNLDKLEKNKSSSSNFSHMPKKPKRSGRSQATPIPIEWRSMPLARDISEVHFETFDTFDADTLDPNHPGGAFEPLLFDNCGIRIVAHELGHGHIIILSDSTFLANGQIGKSDNSVLAVNLVSYALSKARGKKVVFDEYHLGFGYHQTGFRVLGKMLFSTAAGWGSTYRSAGANRLTLELIYDWLKHKATNLAGLTPNASNGTIANELSRRSGSDPQKYKEVFDRCDKLIAQTSLSERHLLLIIKQLVQIEMEIFNEHRNRK